MIESLVRKMDSKRILESNIDKYKEYFIKFYGESERERIEEAFSKILLIPYMTPFTTGIVFSQFVRIINESVLKKYCENSCTFIGYGDFSCPEDFYLYQYMQLVDELKKDKKDEEKICRLFNRLRIILVKIDKDITPSNLFDFKASSVYQELELLSKNYSNMKKEFYEKYSGFENYGKLFKNELKMEAAIERKWYKNFIRDNLNNLPVDIRGEAENYLASDEKKLPESVKMIFGEQLKSSSHENHFILEIQQQEIDNSREEYIKKCQQEIHENHFICKYYQDELDKLGLLNPVKLGEEIASGTTACLPNVRKIDGRYELFCPILIRFTEFEVDDEKIDHNIVHELNHLLELALLDANDEGYRILSGWDLIKYNKDENKNENNGEIKGKNAREYELFNEAINELITQDICKEMQKDNFFVFGTSNTIYDKSGYEFTLYLVREFYKKYKDIILESRKNGNIGIIWDTVGKENFDELSSLFAVHYDAEKDEMKECSEIKAEQESKRDEILSRMEEYSQKRADDANLGNGSIKK